MKIAVLLVMCAMAAIVAATTENAQLRPGIYYIGLSVYRINPTNGAYRRVSSSSWRGTTAAGFFNRRLFAIQRGTMYEVLRTTYRTIASGYRGAKFFIQHGARMYTVLANRPYRVRIIGNRATKTIFAPLYIDPLTMVSTYGHFYCTVGRRWMWIDPTDGDCRFLTGRGNPTAAVAYHGTIYAINRAGNIDAVNPASGATVYTYNFSGLFRGTRSIVQYNNMFYAIGRNGRFYEINPIAGTATAKGRRSNYRNGNPMAAASW